MWPLHVPGVKRVNGAIEGARHVVIEAEVIINPTKRGPVLLLWEQDNMVAIWERFYQSD